MFLLDKNHWLASILYFACDRRYNDLRVHWDQIANNVVHFVTLPLYTYSVAGDITYRNI